MSYIVRAGNLAGPVKLTLNDDGTHHGRVTVIVNDRATPCETRKTRKRKRECYCHTCRKCFSSLGIARHRSGHLDRLEECLITYSNGDTYRHSMARDMQ